MIVTYKESSQNIETLNRCIRNYSQPISFSNIIYRICDFIRSLFGQSDWQRSLKILGREQHLLEAMQLNSPSIGFDIHTPNAPTNEADELIPIALAIPVSDMNLKFKEHHNDSFSGDPSSSLLQEYNAPQDRLSLDHSDPIKFQIHDRIGSNEPIFSFEPILPKENEINRPFSFEPIFPAEQEVTTNHTPPPVQTTSKLISGMMLFTTLSACSLLLYYST